MAASAVHPTCHPSRGALCAGRSDPRSRRSDSNGRPLPSEGSALDPLSYGEVCLQIRTRGQTRTDYWGFARPCVVPYTTRVRRRPRWDGHRASRGDACGTRTRDLRIDNPLLDQPSSRANVSLHSPASAISSGWPDSNRPPRRPERRALPAAPQPVIGLWTAEQRSGGRARSPISWFRARCASVCTTPECGDRPRGSYASGDSNSDPRGKTRSVSHYRRGVGVRAERVELSMDCVHRGLSPARLPISATPARRTVVLRSRCRGPRRARTVTSLRAGELHCHSCSGPEVRGTGFEPVVPEGAWVTARCRHQTSSRGRIGA